MAARRLIFVMVVMLMLSSLAAALVPTRDSDEESTTSSTTAPVATTPGPEPGAGESVEARIDAGASKSEIVRIALGDQLTLQVAANRPGEVAIPKLDLLEAVEPGTPAHFDLLPVRAGTYDVRLVESDRELGQVIVGPPAGKGKEGEERPKPAEPKGEPA